MCLCLARRGWLIFNQFYEPSKVHVYNAFIYSLFDAIALSNCACAIQSIARRCDEMMMMIAR